MTATNQAAPNDIKYFNVKANQTDITSMVVQCDIFQDLFMPTWSCQLAFSDTQNLLMNIPIKPGTEITIVAETEYPTNETKSFKFIVYKISDRMQIKQEHQGYMLNCVTKEFFTNQKERVSKSYKNTSPDGIISSICSEYGLGTLTGSDSDPNRYTLIVPNMSPIAAINWVTRFTKNPSAGADFIFFQSDYGEFKFKSLEKMMVDRSGVKFKQLNPNVLENNNHKDDSFLNIEYYEFVTQHDSMNNFAAGYYGNTVISHNIYDKTFKTTTFAYGDDVPRDKANKPFGGAHFDNAENSHIVFHAVATNKAGSNIQTPSDTFEDWLSSRKTNVMKLEENRLVMTVPGSVSHYKLLGKQVDVELPSHQDLDEAEYLDKYMKGSYVVSAVRHTFYGESYKNTLELCKKRVENPYE